MPTGGGASRSLGINAITVRFRERKGLTPAESWQSFHLGLDHHAEQDFGLIGNAVRRTSAGGCGRRARKAPTRAKDSRWNLEWHRYFCAQRSPNRTRGASLLRGHAMTNEQKVAVVLERLNNDRITEAHSFDIPTTGQSKQNFSKDGEKLKRHIYDYENTEPDISSRTSAKTAISLRNTFTITRIPTLKIKRNFVKELNASTEVVVCTKPPRCFLIPARAGNHNPD